MSDNVIEFKPLPENPAAKPIFGREPYGPKRCDHKAATFLVDSHESRVTCSLCKEVVEAIQVLKMLAAREYWRDRRENADAYARLYAEEQAEKQANKTRKAAYATLYRFGVTPEMYAEEHRRKVQLGELELKQDYSKTLAFEVAQ